LRLHKRRTLDLHLAVMSANSPPGDRRHVRRLLCRAGGMLARRRRRKSDAEARAGRDDRADDGNDRQGAARRLEQFLGAGGAAFSKSWSCGSPDMRRTLPKASSAHKTAEEAAAGGAKIDG